MPVATILEAALDAEEVRTVSDSFGGAKIPGRAPPFMVSTVATAAKEAFALHPGHVASQAYEALQRALPANVVEYLLQAAIRFAFLIELTNLSITSTKMRTRWLPGQIIKVVPGSFANVRGAFSPGNDPRSATFSECFAIFVHVLQVLATPAAAAHLASAVKLASTRHRSIPYEFVFTYRDPHLSPVHTVGNVRLVTLQDLNWLIEARPLLGAILPSHSLEKIRVKSFLTDRAQTGADQTNRAKRWEVLSNDFQHASVEECWSVQRKLFETLPGFEHFPAAHATLLINAGLIAAGVQHALCPITLERLDFNNFQAASAHGHSDYQVGHLAPLKAGGRHIGTNVAWVTDNGNRIQGDYDINTIRALLRGICARMVQQGIVD